MQETPTVWSWTKRLGPMLAPALLLFCVLGCAGSWRAERPKSEYLWLIRYDVKSLDPAAAADWTTTSVLGFEFPSIGEYTEVTKVSPVEYRVKIKLGSTFANGDPVTGDSLRFTITRCLSSGVRSPLGLAYASQIEGAIQVAKGTLAAVSGITLLPRNDGINLRLYRPDVSFGEKLKHRCFGIVNPKFAPANGSITKSRLGTGAGKYAMTTTDPGVEWIMRHTVEEKTIRFRYLVDPAARRTYFDSVKADFAMFAAHDSGLVGKHPNLTVGGPTTVVYLQLNPKTQPEFRLASARRALRKVTQAIPFSTYIDAKIVPISSFMNSYRVTPLQQDSEPTDKVPQIKTTIAHAQSGGSNTAVEVVCMSWTKAGCITTAAAMQSGVMLKSNEDGMIPVLFTGWQPDFDGPLATLPMLFHSTSPENHSGYANPTVDRLLELAQQGISTSENLERAAEIVDRECPVIPLYIQRDTVLQRAVPPKF